MANNYTQFSTMLTGLSPDETAWLLERLKRQETDEDDEDTDPPCLARVEPEGLWLYAEEFVELEQLSGILSEFQTRFNRLDAIIVEWADTCSKMRVNEFGGGAFAVYQGTVEWFHPSRLANAWIASRVRTDTPN